LIQKNTIYRTLKINKQTNKQTNKEANNKSLRRMVALTSKLEKGICSKELILSNTLPMQERRN
jgi:hypothetical protein